MITSYDKLPVGKYLEACAVSCDMSRDMTGRTVAYISILSDMKETEVLLLPLEEFTDMARKTAFLCNDAEPDELADCYRLGSLELVPVRDFRKMTAGQYIDFQALAKNPHDHLVDILAVFLVPKGMKYGDGYEIDDVKAAIRDMLPVTAALALQAFFLKSLHDLIHASLISSERALKLVRNPEKRKMIQSQISNLRHSLKNGDGFALSMTSVIPRTLTGTKSSK